ncbi:MAG: hypothetical protein ACI3YH_00005, partial [Eubacteriales bacterium]
LRRLRWFRPPLDFLKDFFRQTGTFLKKGFWYSENFCKGRQMLAVLCVLLALATPPIPDCWCDSSKPMEEGLSQ